MKRLLVIFLFSVFISVPLITPYFHSGYFPTHDGEWAVVRLGDMFRSIKDLQIPARYSGALNFGYGYPLFNFTYPGPYYLGIAIHLLGFSFITSIKIIFMLSVVFSAFCMFLASNLLWKNKIAGVISSILYLYLPYRIVDLYVRGSIGESISFVLFPLLVYIVIKLIESPSSRLFFCLFSVSFAFLITVHNIMAVLFVPVLLLFAGGVIYFKKKQESIQAVLFAFIGGLGLSAFFWIPALVEKNTILLSKIPIAERSLYFVRINDLLFSKWGYGIPGSQDAFTYQLGWGQAVAMLVAFGLVLFVLLIKKQKEKSFFSKITGFLILLWILISLLLFEWSSFIWQHTPLLKEINYPWILLSQLGFISSLVAGYLVIYGKVTKIIAIFCAVLAIVVTIPFAKPKEFFLREDIYYLTNEATTTSSNELMPLWVKAQPTTHFNDKVFIEGGKGEIQNIQYNSKSITFDIHVDNPGKVTVNTIYYPGWIAAVNEKNQTIYYNNKKGVMQISIPKGKSFVQLKFTETPLRIISNAISVVTLVGLMIFLAVPRKKK